MDENPVLNVGRENPGFIVNRDSRTYFEDSPQWNQKESPLYSLQNFWNSANPRGRGLSISENPRARALSLSDGGRLESDANRRRLESDANRQFDANANRQTFL